jgi:hypothetical protein
LEIQWWGQLQARGKRILKETFAKHFSPSFLNLPLSLSDHNYEP